MEESKNSLLKNIIHVLGSLEKISQSEMQLRNLVLSTGWNTDELIGFNLNDFSVALAPLSGDLQALLTYIENPPDSFGEIDEAFNKAKDAFARITQLKNAFQHVDIEGPDKDKLLSFGEDLLNILVTLYLQSKSPVLFYLLYLLTLIDFDNADLEPIAGPNGKILRYPCLFPKLKPGRISDVFSDPVTYFKQYYFPYGLQTDEDALLAAHKLFPRIAHVLHELKINTHLGFNRNHGVDFGPESNELANAMFSIFFEPNYQNIDFGLTMALSPASRANLGLVMIPFGNLIFSKTFGSWQFNFKLTGSTEAFAIGPEGATLLGDGEAAQLNLNMQVTKLAAVEGEPAILLGGKSGSHFEIGTLVFESGIGIKDAAFDIDFLLQMNKALFVLKGGDTDGFIAKILPANGIQLGFDLGLGWSNHSGLYFKGNAGLEAEYDFYRTFLNVLELQAIRMKIALSPSGVSFMAGAMLQVKLGPVTCVIHEIGIQAETAFVNEGGNAGFANNKISFKPPTGIGLTVDAGGIKGGGFLNFDPDKHEYFGALELEFKDMFSMKALGILNTKMPDGSDGYSLLIIITAEFNPVQLGFGFTLNGIGGLLGINRTTRIEALREGIKTNAIKSILFPENVVANINRIISDVKQVFPPQNDHYLFCPMGKIGWGTPNIITLELGLLIEIPFPGFRILGVLKAVLPDEETSLLRLQVNFLGEIDFENKFIFFRAVLFDSRILTFTLTGEMVLRISWGDNPVFILSVGGFHPAFKEVPADLRNMERLTITLYNEEDARLIVQSYFAITSNTVQYGARAELYAKKGSFNIYGFIGYDVLFQFDPFRFMTDFEAGVALRHNSSVIMSIKVSGHLSGPGLWDARGEASVSFFFFSISVPFHVSWGEAANEISKEKADLLDLLTKEIADNRNWKADIPNNSKLYVSIKKVVAPENSVVVHPFGILTFSERLVPLEMEINKFGNRIPKDATRFEIKTTDDTLTTEAVKEQFAAANFIEMKDEDKLSRPSFERIKSGFKITGSGRLIAPEHWVEKEVNYEFSYLKKKRPGYTGYKYPGKVFKANIKTGAASQSPVSWLNNRVSLNAPQPVNIIQDQYVVAGVGDMKAYSSDLLPGGYAETVQSYNELLKKQPKLKNELQVISIHELNKN